MEHRGWRSPLIIAEQRIWNRTLRLNPSRSLEQFSVTASLYVKGTPALQCWPKWTNQKQSNYIRLLDYCNEFKFHTLEKLITSKS